MRTYRSEVILLVAVMVAAAIVTSSAFNAGRKDSGTCPATGSKATNVVSLDAAEAGNSGAIQEAIDAAAARGGGIIELSTGQFAIHRPLVLKTNVALKGSGPATVLKASSRFLTTKGPYGGHPLITTDGARDVTIANFTADQSGESLEGNVDGRLREYLIDVRHTVNAIVEGVSTKNPFTYSIAVVGSNHFCIRNNSTAADSSDKYDQLDGIHVTDSYSGLVLGNHIDQRQGEDGDDGLVAQTIGAPVHDVTYRKNDVRGGSHGGGMQLAVSGYEIYNITIEDNRFWDSPSGIRTGYYGGESQAVHDITVRGNLFLDLEGASTNFYGKLRNIQIVDNRVCRSGDMKVQDGPDNLVAGNIGSCEL